VKAAQRLALAAAGLLVLPAAAAGQCLPNAVPDDPNNPCRIEFPRWTGHVAAAGVNAAVHGLTAGVWAAVHGRDFSDAFVLGAAGGTLTYGGKAMVGQRWDGAGLLGRQVAALGASLTRNAADGVGAIDRLVFPVGIGRLYVTPRGARPVRFRADALALGWTVYGIVEEDVELDWGASLSAGTPVFLTDGKLLAGSQEGAHAAGVTHAGVVFAADVPFLGSAFRARSLAHERAHVLQGDQLFVLFTNPAEDLVLRNTPWLNRLEPWLDVNLSTQLIEGLGHLFPEWEERPWELEATFVGR
jgi:hypothetical protein